MNKHTDTDALIITQIIQGDSAAFRILVEKYKDMSFSLACSILKDEEEAEDILQDAFLKAFKNLKKFRGDSSFATWLYRIVLNTSFTARDKKKKRYSNEIQKSYPTNTWERSWQEPFLEDERKRLIHEALKIMKAEESLLLRLFYLSELSIEEIEKVTHFSRSKIKITLYRGRKSMYECLKQLVGDELKHLL